MTREGDLIRRQATLAEFKRLYYDDKTVIRCAELVINGMPSVNPQKEGEYLKSAIRISKNIPKEMVEKVFFDTQAKMEGEVE